MLFQISQMKYIKIVILIQLEKAWYQILSVNLIKIHVSMK